MLLTYTDANQRKERISSTAYQDLPNSSHVYAHFKHQADASCRLHRITYYCIPPSHASTNNVTTASAHANGHPSSVHTTTASRLRLRAHASAQLCPARCAHRLALLKQPPPLLDQAHRIAVLGRARITLPKSWFWRSAPLRP
jgi:hypothetical protein